MSLPDLSPKEKRALATLARWKLEELLVDFTDDFDGEADRLPAGVLVHVSVEEAQDYVRELLRRLPKGLRNEELDE